MKRVYLISVILVSILVGCGNTLLETPVHANGSLSISEDRLFASDGELNAIASRAITDAVDWQLAHFIAVAQLQSLIESSEIPMSALRERPIIIYDQQGEPEYYEFRAYSGKDPVAAITIVARESMGNPVAYQIVYPENYSETLNVLFKEQPVTVDKCIKVISDGYPNYAYGTLSVGFKSVSLDAVYDSETGQAKPIAELQKLVSVENMLLKQPSLFDGLDIVAMMDEIDSYRYDVQECWTEIKAAAKDPSAFYIKPSNSRVLFAYGVLNGYRKTMGTDRYYHHNNTTYRGWRKGWCGPSSINWALGYMKDLNKPGLSNYYPFLPDCFSQLTVACKCESNLIYGVTMPADIGPAISFVTNNYYTANWSSWEGNKAAINSGYPVISLRSANYGSTGLQWHYRDMVGYKSEGYYFLWIKNSWNYYYIHDMNDWDGKGVWEAYNPLYHVFTAAIAKK